MPFSDTYRKISKEECEEAVKRILEEFEEKDIDLRKHQEHTKKLKEK
jgi:hypothetical protein